jgi:hypothetical protein
MIHELKTNSDNYLAVVYRIKRFELRFDDRNYQIGDILRLKETVYTDEEMKSGKPLEYTGNTVDVTVNYILFDKPNWGLEPGWVIMSIE